MRLQVSTMLMLSICIMTLSTTTISSGADTMRIVDTTADAGTLGVEVPIVATFDQAIQGLNISMRYELESNISRPSIECMNFTVVGTAIETLIGGAPEFFALSIDHAATLTHGHVTVGMIFDIDPVADVSLPASPATEVELGRFVFDVTGNDVPNTFALELFDGLGTPPLNNHFSAGGFSYVPSTTDGVFSVTNNFRMYIADLTIPAGSPVPVTFFADFPLDCNGVEMTFVYDPADATVTVPSLTADPVWYQGMDVQTLLTTTPGGSTVEFIFVQELLGLPGGLQGWQVSMSFDQNPPFEGQVVPAGVSRSITQVTVVANPTLPDGDVIDFGLTTDFGAGCSIIVLGGAQAPIPILSGELTIGVASGFRRGDPNSDGVLNLADPIFIIQYIFAGGTAPSCFDSADSNDDGAVNIADAIFLIQHLFTDGAAPPAPGPGPGCGVDPTDDGLICGIYASACP